jgi:GTP-binding protein EngB required for normal cell division
MPSDTERLNEGQQRRLWVTCKHIDDLLSDMEDSLHEASSKKAFPKYVNDVSPAQRRLIEDYIARMRAQLVRVLRGQQIEPPKGDIPVSRSLHTSATFIDIDVEELKPKYMRGYGTVPEAVATDLNGIVGELQGLVDRLYELVQQGAGEDLRERLKKLEQEGGDLEALNALEKIISKYGLVEFRSPVSIILDRLEDKSFEIAIFGRVSSGKSSLLNGILLADVLPVGVTPITAVPTRIAFGEQQGVVVWFAEKPAQRFDLAQLPHFVSEQLNPGNARHVSRILVQLHSQHLRDGIVFVDTPGLGSLATAGAAETLAYLPRCDLGVVLIDAASSITPDDIQTIQALYQAGTPANVLVSKADLLRQEDLERLIEYTKKQILSQLRLDLPIHPVSSLPAHRQLLDRWFADEIRPLYERAQELKKHSIQRKIGSLRQSVGSALEAQIRRSQHGVAETDPELAQTEAQLRHTTARLEEARPAIRRITDDIIRDSNQIATDIAKVIVNAWESQEAGKTAAPAVSEIVHAVVQKRAAVVESYLRNMTQELATEIRAVADKLELSDAPAEEEFQKLIREMPVFEFAANFRGTRPKLSAMLGRGYAENSVVSQFQHQDGTSFNQALITYAALLQDWAERVLKQIRQRFEMYAEGYRAQLERSLGGKKIAPEVVADIQRDLAALEPREPVPGRM